MTKVGLCFIIGRPFVPRHGAPVVVGAIVAPVLSRVHTASTVQCNNSSNRNDFPVGLLAVETAPTACLHAYGSSFPIGTVARHDTVRALPEQHHTGAHLLKRNVSRTFSALPS